MRRPVGGRRKIIAEFQRKRVRRSRPMIAAPGMGGVRRGLKSQHSDGHKENDHRRSSRPVHGLTSGKEGLTWKQHHTIERLRPTRLLFSSCAQAQTHTSPTSASPTANHNIDSSIVLI